MIALLKLLHSSSRRRRSRIRTLWLPVVALSLLGGYALSSRAFSNAAAPTGPAAGPLRMNIESTKQGLILTWDRGPGAAWIADRAVLTIIDGNRAEHVELNPLYVRRSRIRYLPLNSDVAFHLELSDRAHGASASGWVRCRNSLWPAEPDPGSVEVRIVSFQLLPPDPPQVAALGIDGASR